MDLRLLRYFIAVAEEGHVTRAAERLGMQQPPLSQQIKILERELGVQLFRRKPRGVELTDAGRAFLGEAREIFVKLDHAVDTARRASRGELGKLSIGISSTAHFIPLVPRLIREFRESYPQVSIDLQEAGSSELIELARLGQLDIVFIRKLFAPVPGLAAMHLLNESMVVALPSTHALAPRKTIPLKALSEEIFITYRRPEGPGLSDVIEAACHAAGFSLRSGQEAPRPASALNLVAAGNGICIVPASLQRMQLDGVLYRPLASGSQLKAPLHLISRRNDGSPVLRNFLKMVARTPKSSMASGHPLYSTI
jgi:DNA-binding transcriptional LysR family regulator